ncbi:MAG: dTMP kinase [Hyphomicrobiales bacterium]|nr:dTMP kinase [Hyphomicrobiales bacterium]
MAARFITFEGGEGAGKSTQIRQLAARLRERDIPVIETREPGGTEAAEAIRSLLLSGSIKSLGPEAEALMFAAARVDHVDRLIRPALARGDWVLCDRFFDSTRVYQGEAGGVGPAMLDSLERIAVGRCRPDLTLVLDLPAEVGLGRVTSRLKESGDQPDRFEVEDVDLHERRRLAFISIAARAPERCVVVNADRPEAAVAEDVWRVVDLRFLQEAA